MKKISIKLRVTLWFTLLMLLLVAVVLAFLFSVGERLVISGSKDTLIGIVDGSLDEIEYDDGELEIDDDLDFFQKGVYISVYDSSGRLLYGRLPTDFTGDFPFADGQATTVPNDDNADAWYLYDVQHKVGRYGSVWVRGVMSSEGSGNAFEAMLTLAAVALPFLVLLAAVGGYLIIDRAFRPVRQIREAAEKIGESKDLSERIGLGSGRDEIYTLAATFDHMFDRLQSAFEREKQFTSDASHELRTPIAVIISQCEYALETADEAKAALETVLRQSQRMSALITQLLMLSRADKGQAKLQLEIINISELIEMVAEQTRDFADEKNITVETEIEPDILLRGDETMLMRMLLNLMENGVKYGRSGGTLRVGLSSDGGSVVGNITDDGIGIAAENIPKIWERFYQADPARSSVDDGIGLGLPMVKYIAEAHGGSVSVKSALGKGSTFTFKIPIKSFES